MVMSVLFVQIRGQNLKTRVIGCPKTIDGDLKCKEVPTSFGFDTACRVIITITQILTLHFSYILSFMVS